MVTMKQLLVYIGILMTIILAVIGTTLGILYSNGAKKKEPKREIQLVIDHDGGADDAFAISIAVLVQKYHKGPKLIAITTTHGNVKLDQVLINTDRILTVNKRTEVPIYAGAESALISGIESDYYYGHDGLGDDGYKPPGPITIEAGHAANVLIDLSKKHEGNLTIIALGPLTNIALAIKLDPDFLTRLNQLYVGGGHIFGPAHQDPEFNAAMDPEAYYIVTEAATTDKVTVVPFSQVYRSLPISKGWREEEFGAITSDKVQALNSFERISLASSKNWIQLDPAVAAVALKEEIVDEYIYSDNSIFLCGKFRGINRNDFTCKEPNVRMVYKCNKQKYMKFLLDLFSAE